MRIELGATVRCESKVVGHLADVLIDPAAWRLTHVAVEVDHGEKRLVPADAVAVEADGSSGVSLGFSLDDLEASHAMRQFAFVEIGEQPPAEADTDVGIEDFVSSPSLGISELGAYVPPYENVVALAYDRIPKGEAELGPSSEVHTADGKIVGRVAGVKVNAGDVTHVVVEYGHLWGTHETDVARELVEKLSTDAVVLRMTEPELKALPASRRHRLPSFL